MCARKIVMKGGREIEVERLANKIIESLPKPDPLEQVIKIVEVISKLKEVN